MQPFTRVDGSIASQTVQTSIGSIWPFQYALSSCHGTRFPLPLGLQMKWVEKSARSGPRIGSTSPRIDGSKAHSRSFGCMKCGTSMDSGRSPAGSSASTRSK